MELPPGVEETPQGLVRRLIRTSVDGKEWTQTRRVAPTLEEARSKRWDWYHPELGWILEGYKLEKDRSVESILADNSMGMPRPPELDEEPLPTIKPAREKAESVIKEEPVA